jgi:GH15 family glucan-1,4-alpha-glucosidase
MLDPSEAYVPIKDYAVIGDCRTAALVSNRGSIDWLCLPRFDSPSWFGAILDRERGGRFRISPPRRFSCQRRYVGSTNVLETSFRTDTGLLRLTDLMPVAAESGKHRELRPEQELLRKIECVEGEAELEILYDPRPDYGRHIPRLADRGVFGICCEHSHGLLALRSEIPLARLPSHPGYSARLRLRAGDRRFLSLIFSREEPSVFPVLAEIAERRVAESLRWWEHWASQCTYQGPYADEVIRSGLTLKLMTFAPSGAVVAAPTASLPERLGGVRNWDYRYCWLRDASMILRNLDELGYEAEEQAFLSWMLHATRLTQPELQVVYNVFGEAHLPERELSHLEGYARSQPVRVGNAADRQLQLDVYGEVVDGALRSALGGDKLDRVAARMLIGIGHAVCRRWREPDHGIWEMRSSPAHYTFSKAMCWVALDLLIQLHDRGHVDAPVERFAKERDAIRDVVETRGYSERLQSYVSLLDGDEVDASLLLLGLRSYADPRSPRMRNTTARIREQLRKNGLIYRYRSGTDELPPGEGAFAVCSFWMVECQARQGAVDGAVADFEHILSLANDVGLFAEQIDPDDGAALGNFPQAYSHGGLIRVALTLAECLQGSDRSRSERDARVGAT